MSLELRKHQPKSVTKSGIYVHMQLVAPFRKLPWAVANASCSIGASSPIYESFDQTGWTVEICVKSLVPRKSHQNLVIIKPSATWQFFLIDAGSLLEVFAFLCGSMITLYPAIFSEKSQIESPVRFGIQSSSVPAPYWSSVFGHNFRLTQV